MNLGDEVIELFVRTFEDIPTGCLSKTYLLLLTREIFAIGEFKAESGIEFDFEVVDWRVAKFTCCDPEAALMIRLRYAGQIIPDYEAKV